VLILIIESSLSHMKAFFHAITAAGTQWLHALILLL